MFNNFVILSSKAVMSYYVYLHQSNMKAFPCVQVEYIYIVEMLSTIQASVTKQAQCRVSFHLSTTPDIALTSRCSCLVSSSSSHISHKLIAARV